jgi:hypothetical protein
MVRVILYLSFDAETYPIARYLPGQKQLENRLYYFRKRKFGYHNEIVPLEEKLRKFVFTGDEAGEQAFIYHYQTDRHDRLCVGDGSDK